MSIIKKGSSRNHGQNFGSSAILKAEQPCFCHLCRMVCVGEDGDMEGTRITHCGLPLYHMQATFQSLGFWGFHWCSGASLASYNTGPVKPNPFSC